MKNILDYAKWEINEGLSSLLYHFTRLGALYNILKNNEIACSSALTGYEKELSGGKPFYVSTQRSKNGYLGYAGGGGNLTSCIVLYGDKIRSKYSGKPVDYWKMSKDKGDYMFANQFIDAVKSHELEDRIVSNEPTIKDITNYIKEIHVFVPADATDGQKILLRDITAKATALSLQLFTYDKLEYFKIQQKNKAIDISDKDHYNVTDEMRPETNTYDMDEHILSVFRSTLFALTYDNPLAYEHLVHYFNGDMPKDYAEKLSPEKNNSTLKSTSIHDAQSIASFISNEVSNSKIYHGKLKTLILSLFSKDIKKSKAKNIHDYILIKYGYADAIKKEKQKPKKISVLYLDGERKSEEYWNKGIWHWTTPDDFWNALPEDFAYSIDTIKKGKNSLERSYVAEVMDNENATFKQVYNMLLKRIGRKKTNEVLLKLNIEVEVQGEDDFISY